MSHEIERAGDSAGLGERVRAWAATRSQRAILGGGAAGLALCLGLGLVSWALGVTVAIVVLLVAGGAWRLRALHLSAPLRVAVTAVRLPSGEVRVRAQLGAGRRVEALTVRAQWGEREVQSRVYAMPCVGAFCVDVGPGPEHEVLALRLSATDVRGVVYDAAQMYTPSQRVEGRYAPLAAWEGPRLALRDGLGLLGLLLVAQLAQAAPTWEGQRAEGLVRVDWPGAAGALGSSATGSVLAAPPEPGLPWRWESVPEPDLAPGTAKNAIAMTQADEWHAAGFRGQGVKIAVFDLGWFGAERGELGLADLQTHDCAADPSCDLPMAVWRPRASFEEGVHGLACAEVVRALAPDAEIHLVRVNTFTMLENAIDWAIREDIDLISMSLSFYNDSFYDGTGPHAPLINRLSAAGGLMVTSAGNNAKQHWWGDYQDRDLDGWADLEGDGALELKLPAGGGKAVYVSWNQFGRCGDTDLDVIVRNAADEIVGRSEDVQAAGADRCQPYERVSVNAEAGGTFYLSVQKKSGAEVGLELDILTRTGEVVRPIAAGSITDPATHPRALAVAAVDVDRYLTRRAEGFSSEGPTQSGLDKPDIAGPDGLITATYGGGGFFGTSASTPAVTGLLAILISADPDAGAEGARAMLLASAFGADADGGKRDPSLGAGKARLPSLDAAEPGCGRGPAWAGLLIWPWWWRRRRTRRVDSR